MWCVGEGIGMWSSWLGILWMLIVGGGFIALIAWGVTWLTRSGNMATQSSPYDVAKQRYAKGEISKEEFEEIKRGLS
jgi:putative membrane protein